MSNCKKSSRLLPLTPDEEGQLQEHELVISQGLQAFVAVGLALVAIRTGKLYRATHKTFELYCRDRWDLGKSRAYQLIEASEIACEMSTNGGQIIENERQARALAAIPPHLRKEVLDRIKSAGDDVTEQTVTRAVVALLDEKRQAAKERDQGGATEDDADVEEDTPQEEEETPVEKGAKRAAKSCAKARLYLARGLEHLRLAVKDLRKVQPVDLGTDDAQQAAREALDAADAVFSTVRGMFV